MKENNNAPRGIGFIDLLTVVFIVLKLTKVITWSWWWVLSPMWITFSLLLICEVALAIIEKRKSGIDEKVFGLDKKKNY